MTDPTVEEPNFRDTTGSLLASPARCQREWSRSVTEPTVEESNYRDTTGSLLASSALCQREWSRAVTEPTVEESNYWDTTGSLLASPAQCDWSSDVCFPICREMPVGDPLCPNSSTPPPSGPSQPDSTHTDTARD